ncbi:valine--tRNA ligase [Ferruginibacter sp. HRS2-29]|uniref:valine--tRNA ligase n=1 Tax=Ferruginibacter sp. HRS2-29 TaxID=2487334 RepID=UPI0020CD83F1|nr:valine--tRNA ligase [Ferruginibacter sp. HRS2-29]MCP9749361.1 valine--tRNA ligase [Ferruginibacter sp. HRS2-29]
MELSKNFEPQAIDNKWYKHWMDKGYFNSTPDGREAYTIVMPPPNVTGVLHMGHALNNTIQDILIRHARMQGKNACWVPGTDHASIATEAKVVAMLRERGITKSSLTRDEFLAYAWEWKEKYGGIILQQLKKLGCSLDWNRTSFTMDKDYYASVIKVFVDLYEKGLIYRGKRMVNWDPVSLTALSDEEVIFKDVDSKLYFVHYKLENGDPGITVATTRPETILGDVAICVNPADERYSSLIGKEVIVPIINRRIPIIADEYVSADFGTGALKITPAHDKNDNMLGLKHNLKAIDTLDVTGKFTAEELLEENPSELVLSYVGTDRFALRKKIVQDMEELGQIIRIEDYKGQVGTSERTGAVIESKLSMQWFIDMKKFLEKNPQSLSAVMDDTIEFHPAKAKNTYSHWLNNIKDWCISRQLWWGQRIPAWYDEEGNYYVAATEAEARQQAAAKSPTFNLEHSTLSQDEDVLDTWFSSWLWPMEVFKGISNPGNEEVKYYYPSTTLVTGQDIIFFWVARMIMAGYEYEQEYPFKDVYFTGMVRDKQGRKMSKQLGNSPDLLGLIDQYGADAVRFGIMIASPAGNDLLFDESSLEQGRNFNNKLWNALKLVKMWEGKQTTDDRRPTTESIADNSHLTTHNFAISWFENRLAEVCTEVDTLMKQFRLSEALKSVYSLIWTDFCSWYLEWVKPGFEQPIDAGVYKKTIGFFSELMQLLHPFMPFVSEELYHQLEERTDDLCVKQMRSYPSPDTPILQHGDLLKDTITAIRDVRNKQQVKPKETIVLHIQSENKHVYAIIESLLAKQVNASAVHDIFEPVEGTVTLVLGKDKFYIQTPQPLNTTGQKEGLLKELDHLKGFLASVEKKLGNEKFVQNARPDVLALEQKKKSDAESKIKVIEESLAGL